MEIDKDKTLTATICWDKTQMLLKGSADQIHTRLHTALGTFLPTFIRPLKTFQLKREGCQLVSSTPNMFITSGKKRKKKNLNSKNIGKSSLLLHTIFQQFGMHLWLLAF